MNARGLIELILLNIGLQAGIITPTLFTILVFVAIVTTLMATPIFEFVYGRHRKLSDRKSQIESGHAKADRPRKCNHRNLIGAGRWSPRRFARQGDHVQSAKCRGRSNTGGGARGAGICDQQD